MVRQLLVCLEVETNGTSLVGVCFLVGMGCVNSIFDFDGQAFCLRFFGFFIHQSKYTSLQRDGDGVTKSFFDDFRTSLSAGFEIDDFGSKVSRRRGWSGRLGGDFSDF